MKVMLPTKRLAQALATVKPAIHPNRPFVVLDTTSADLLVAADNWDVQIRTQLDDVFTGKGNGGVAAVPIRPLAELCSRLATDEVEMVRSGDVVEVRSGDTDMRLPVADFDLPQRKEPDADEVTVNAVDWEALWRVAQHASEDDNRPVLQTVFFQGDVAAATDAFRLAFYEVDTGIHSNVPANMITRVRDEDVDDVVFVADDQVIKITVGPTTAWGLPIAGDAPPWKGIVPDKAHGRMVFDAEALKDAISRVQITARDIHGGGRAIDLNPLEEGRVVVKSQPEAGDTFGECSEVIELIEGEMPWSMGFNSRFLTDAIETMDSDKFEVELGESAMKPIQTTHAGFSIVLMPLKPL